jgi:hypothetical protein
MPTSKPHSSFFRNVALFFCALLLGLPVVLVFTHGTILVPLLIVAVLGPFVALHYLLWGWWLSPRQKSESTPAEGSLDPTHFPSTPSATGIRSKERGESYFR